MPKGQPTAAQVVRGEITFFSLDTDLIQSAGFDFDAGSLNQLPKQIPKSMGLQLTDVVVREIVKHRMQPVREAIHKIEGASRDLVRLAGTPMAMIDQSFAALAAADAASTRFRDQACAYAAQCRGGVLPITGAELAAEVFDRYFDVEPPFEANRAKKAEFPDATSLILLERFARENETKGVVASRDAGWAAFADASEYLYAISSIDELATLFVATGAHATALKTKLLEAANDPHSALRIRLRDALEHHVMEADWDASEMFSGVGHRLEAEVINVDLRKYRVQSLPIDVWPVEDDPATWIAEVVASVEVAVHLDINFFVWDSIDKEEMSIGYDTVEVAKEIEVVAYLNCSDVELGAEIEGWQIETDIASRTYPLGEVEVIPDFSDRD